MIREPRIRLAVTIDLAVVLIVLGGSFSGLKVGAVSAVHRAVSMALTTVMFSVLLIRCMAPRMVDLVLVCVSGSMPRTMADVGVTMPFTLKLKKKNFMSRTYRGELIRTKTSTSSESLMTTSLFATMTWQLNWSITVVSWGVVKSRLTVKGRKYNFVAKALNLCSIRRQNGRAKATFDSVKKVNAIVARSMVQL